MGFLLAFLWITSTVIADAEHITLPVQQHKDDGKEHAIRSADVLSSPVDFGLHQHWWYGTFDIGDSKNLSLQIDTSSGTMIINSGLYKPSSRSVSLHQPDRTGFGTMQANGCGTANFKYRSFTDTVSMAGGLVATNQVFGEFVENPPKGFRKTFPRDGIVGMSLGSFQEHLGWWRSLCKQGRVEECKYGLAFGTGGKGSIIFGGVDESLFEGELTPAKYPEGGWQANIVINGSTTLIRNRTTALYDSGTANIIIPATDAHKLFNQLGMQAVEHPHGYDGCHRKVIYGYYPCNNPPTVGLQYIDPNGTSYTDTNGPVFNIEPEAQLLYDNGGNNCTSIIVGEEAYDSEPAWTIGQAWMQGKYVDHNWQGVMVGVATLKDKTVRA